MHIWRLDNWEKILPKDGSGRTGLRFRCDKNVDPEVKRACLQFGKWLRAEYYFPVRIVVYVKEAERIRAKDGDYVVGTFFEPCMNRAQKRIQLHNRRLLLESFLPL